MKHSDINTLADFCLKTIETEKDASKQIRQLINKAKKEKKVFSYRKAVIYTFFNTLLS